MNMKNVKQLGARIANAGKTKAQLEVNAEAIRALADLLAETGLGEIEVEQGGQRIRVARPGSTQPSIERSTTAIAEPAVVPREASSPPPARRESDGTIASPMVGTVYVAPEPGKPPFVKIGDSVSEGDTLLVVEAMKTILAPRAGIVKEICVRDSQPVEFGQSLLVLSSLP
jgi:acetyl-CoA carboxylase biotin carboxyl carrier protein